MKRYKDVFGDQKTFFPVVHVVDEIQAFRNVDIAFANGADGIFLIQHDHNTQLLLEAYFYVRESFLTQWIGLNFLGLTLRQTLNRFPESASGIWWDNAYVREDMLSTSRSHIYFEFKDLFPQALVFGGIAFKYQPEVEFKDLAKVARNARLVTDVATTSGEKTGKAADIEKIKTIRHGLYNHPMAVASGITVENVRDFLPLVDSFLVATGVSDSFTELNPQRVRELAETIHSI